jgi:hypothetical protein
MSATPSSVPTDASYRSLQPVQNVTVIPPQLDAPQVGLILQQHLGASSSVPQEFFQYQQQGEQQVSHSSVQGAVLIEDQIPLKQNQSIDQPQNHESIHPLCQSRPTPVANAARSALPSQQLQMQSVPPQSGVSEHRTLVSDLTQLSRQQQQLSAQHDSLSGHRHTEGLSNGAVFVGGEKLVSQHQIMNGPSLQTFLSVPESLISPPPPSNVFASTGIPLSDTSQVSGLSMHSSLQQNAPTMHHANPLVASREQHQVLAEKGLDVESVPSNSGYVIMPQSTRDMSRSIESSGLPLLNQTDAPCVSNVEIHNLLPEISSQSPKVSNCSTSFGSAEGQLAENMHDSSRNGSMASLSDEVDTDDELLSEELRKLDEDFQRNIQRAKKVFDNRMDNLQRSQVEREAQHLKTLEKHEKERLEFEKRLALEAEQQNKRIELLQREWDKRRESVALHKRKKHGRNGTHSSLDLSQENPQSEHLRTLSTASSNFSISPALASHKTASEPIVIATDVSSTSQARKFPGVDVTSTASDNTSAP